MIVFVFTLLSFDSANFLTARCPLSVYTWSYSCTVFSSGCLGRVFPFVEGLPCLPVPGSWQGFSNGRGMHEDLGFPLRVQFRRLINLPVRARVMFWG